MKRSNSKPVSVWGREGHICTYVSKCDAARGLGVSITTLRARLSDKYALKTMDGKTVHVREEAIC